VDKAVLPKRTTDITGHMFGSWTVESYAGCRGEHAVWNCRCVCSAVKTVIGRTLRNGRSKSCGCTRPVGSQWTPEQHRTSKRKYRQETPGYRARESKRWREKNPEKAKLFHRQTYYRTRYGIELEQAEAILAKQGHVCGICRKPVTLSGKTGAKLDHCHESGKVRGVLCHHCNIGLGQFRDDPTILSAAVAYVRRHVAPEGEIGVAG
jgi:hypothetical protein